MSNDKRNKLVASDGTRYAGTMVLFAQQDSVEPPRPHDYYPVIDHNRTIWVRAEWLPDVDYCEALDNTRPRAGENTLNSVPLTL